VLLRDCHPQTQIRRSEIVEKEAVKTDRGHDGTMQPKIAKYLPKALDKMKLVGSKKVQTE
jgi:hypothetical protein